MIQNLPTWVTPHNLSVIAIVAALSWVFFKVMGLVMKIIIALAILGVCAYGVAKLMHHL